jgi:chlorobactene glucosyltransferase
LVVLSSLGLVIGLAITYWLHSQYHLDVTARPGVLTKTEPPLISVIVPARNEARNIERCVRLLLAQSYLNMELIVVDDRSTDETPHILAEIQAERTDEKLRIVQGADLPPGWAGKPHALHQGIAAAQGQWLCFVDADTFAHPDLLGAAYRTAWEQAADLFTILTRQELLTFWERVILPLVFTALSVGFSPRRVNDPKYPEAVANGQFILIRRSVYHAVGGYESIRGQVVEDKALAEQVKRSGYRLVVGDGRQVASTRMYTSLNEIWEGWTKNIYLGMRDRVGLLLVGAVVGLVGALLLPAWLLAGAAWYFTSDAAEAALIAAQAAVLWMVLLAVRARASQAFGISGWYAFTLPLGALIFTAMMLASAYKVISGQGVTWKGRRYTR